MSRKGKSFFLETCVKAPGQELPLFLPTERESSFWERLSKRLQKPSAAVSFILGNRGRVHLRLNPPPPPSTRDLPGWPLTGSSPGAGTTAQRRPGPLIPSPSWLRAQEAAPLDAPGAGLRDTEEDSRQQLPARHSFMERWQPLRRPAGPPFPPSGTPGGFALSQPLQSAGSCATCRAAGRWGGTGDP